MAGDSIERFYETHQKLYEFLLQSGEPTFAVEANNNFRRSLILAIASYFEHEITDIVRGISKIHANGSSIICELLEQKAINRQYHTYFDWEKKNANKFFGLFGAEFQAVAKEKVRGDSSLDQAIKNFLELGDTRNRLVHLNYVVFDVDKTPNDIMSLFRSSLIFVDFLTTTLLKAPDNPDAPGHSDSASGTK
ncbi:hypothetical protein E9232_006323 [Inquilinus ginsengisoli]|uniref:RiboL-PSP-HEPN domain-containing protein n=1 Tax=Inquilinus ginsengisoli TaxID=363840 RepID=A0ABU1JYR0_9PROT|nr:HEPN domain-containing protein [Inquilinus ginsengisoli]MDR6293770.1 hypothetical protein [Inquilinus ginsengisoli]